MQRRAQGLDGLIDAQHACHLEAHEHRAGEHLCMVRVIRRLYGGIYGGMLAVCTVERGWPGDSGVSSSIAHSLLGLLVLYYLSARVKTLRSGDRDCAMGLVCIQGPMVGGEGEHRDPRDHSQGDEQHDAKLLALAVEEA